MADFSQIELVKENARPVKAGRDSALLGRALAASSTSRDAASSFAKERETRRAAFEDQLSKLTSSDSDPLLNWREYIAWLQQAYPNSTTGPSSSSSGILIDALERCTRFIKSDPVLFARYRNDVEYVKVWVAYADLLPDPAEVFKFLHLHRIGEDCSLTYIAWAWVAEVRSNFAFADKVYTRGMSRKAEPLERLKIRYSEFQHRMYKKWINGVASGEVQVDNRTSTTTSSSSSSTASAHSNSNGGATIRAASSLPSAKEFNSDYYSKTVDLEKLSVAIKGGGQESTSSTATTTSASSSRPSDENGGPRPLGVPREALGRITGHAAVRSHRDRAFADDGAYVGSEAELHSLASGLSGGAQVSQQQASQDRRQVSSLTAGTFPARSTTRVSSTTTTAPSTSTTIGASAAPSIASTGSRGSSSNVQIQVFEEEQFSNVARSSTASSSGFVPFDDNLGEQVPNAPTSSASIGRGNSSSGSSSSSSSSSLSTKVAQQQRAIWSDLGTEAGRRKENTIEASKWNEHGPLIQHAGVRPIAPPLPRRPDEQPIADSGSFLVYEDDELVSAEQTSTRSSAYLHPPALSERPKGAVTSKSEDLFANPLSRFEKAASAAPPAPAPAAPLAPRVSTQSVAGVPTTDKNLVKKEVVQAVKSPKGTTTTLAKLTSTLPQASATTSSSSNNERTSLEEIRAMRWLEKNPEIARQIESEASRRATQVHHGHIHTDESTANLPIGFMFNNNTTSISSRRDDTARPSLLQKLGAYLDEDDEKEKPEQPAKKQQLVKSSSSSVHVFSPEPMTHSTKQQSSILAGFGTDLSIIEPNADTMSVGSLINFQGDTRTFSSGALSIQQHSHAAPAKPFKSAASAAAAAPPAAKPFIFSDFDDEPEAPVHVAPKSTKRAALTVIEAPLSSPSPSRLAPSKAPLSVVAPIAVIPPRLIEQPMIPFSDDNDMTINTRLAIADVDLIFGGSSSAPPRGPTTSQASSAPIQKSVFSNAPAVFNEDQQQQQQQQQQPKPAAAAARGERVLPPDARRLSMMFGAKAMLSRRESLSMPVRQQQQREQRDAVPIALASSHAFATSNAPTLFGGGEGRSPIQVSPIRNANAASSIVHNNGAKQLSFSVFEEGDENEGGGDEGGGDDENKAPANVRSDLTARAREQAHFRRVSAGITQPLSPLTAEHFGGGPYALGRVTLHDEENFELV